MASRFTGLMANPRHVIPWGVTNVYDPLRELFQRERQTRKQSDVSRKFQNAPATKISPNPRSGLRSPQERSGLRLQALFCLLYFSDSSEHIWTGETNAGLPFQKLQPSPLWKLEEYNNLLPTPFSFSQAFRRSHKQWTDLTSNVMVSQTLKWSHKQSNGLISIQNALVQFMVKVAG